MSGLEQHGGAQADLGKVTVAGWWSDGIVPVTKAVQFNAYPDMPILSSFHSQPGQMVALG